MNRDRLFSCLCGGALAFCISFAAIACMVTGLSLDASLVALGIGCGVTAAIASAVYCFGRDRFLKVFLLSSVVILFLNDRLMAQTKAMLAHILDYYDRAYGLILPEFLEKAEPASHLMPLLLIGGIVAVLCCRTVCRAKGAGLTLVAACVPLASCLVVTDTVPHSRCLFWLFFGLSLLLLTQSVRRREPRNAPKLTAGLAVPLALVLSLLFLFVPQEKAVPDMTVQLNAVSNWLEGLFPQFTTDSNGLPMIDFGGEVKQEVNLAALGNRYESNSTVMEVTATFTDTLYLRGRSYAVYDGKTWFPTEGMEENFRISPAWVDGNVENVRIKTKMTLDCRYLPYYPNNGEDVTDGWTENTMKIKEYVVFTQRMMSNWRHLWQMLYGKQGSVTLPGYDLDDALSGSLASDEIIYGVVGADVDPVYWELTESTYQGAAEILRRDIYPNMKPSYSRLDLVNAIQNYVKNSAVYDTKPGRMPAGKDFALWFLEESDKGYCVHFASAAVVLLRAARIPARYVEGYMTPVEDGQTVQVKGKMAHAWVEYHVNGVGWVIMDPTPSAQREPDPTSAPTDPTEATEKPTDPATKPSESGTEPTKSTAPKPTEPAKQEPKELPEWLAPLLGWLAAVAGTATLIWGQWYLRRRLIVQAQRKGSSNQRALARWREIVRLCRMLKKKPSEDLRALAEKAKFSQHTLRPEELAEFVHAQRELTEQLRKKPWYLRVAYRLILAAY